jgi:hypothetical protein
MISQFKRTWASLLSAKNRLEVRAGLHKPFGPPNVPEIQAEYELAAQQYGKLVEQIWPWVGLANNAIEAHMRKHGAKATFRAVAYNPRQFGKLRRNLLTRRRDKAFRKARKYPKVARHYYACVARWDAARAHLKATAAPLPSAPSELSQQPLYADPQGKNTAQPEENPLLAAIPAE